MILQKNLLKGDLTRVKLNEPLTGFYHMGKHNLNDKLRQMINKVYKDIIKEENIINNNLPKNLMLSDIIK